MCPGFAPSFDPITTVIPVLVLGKVVQVLESVTLEIQVRTPNGDGRLRSGYSITSVFDPA